VTGWTPAIWRTLPTRHVPQDYPDSADLARAEAELAARPPLVQPREVRRLHELMAIAADGRRAGTARKVSAITGPITCAIISACCSRWRWC